MAVGNRWKHLEFSLPLSKRSFSLLNLSTYILFAGREVLIGINCARSLEYVLKTEATVFPDTDRPSPANNVFIIFFRKVLCKQFFTAAIFKPWGNKIHFRYDSCCYLNP